jgi:ketosteroid isomerase-like protein
MIAVVGSGEKPMRASHSGMLLCCLALACAPTIAQTSIGDLGKAPSTIKQVLSDQQDAWNRGDIDTFMHGYKNSPDTTFIGKTIAHGYQPILDRYRKSFATREAMGTLDFSDLVVKMLGKNYGLVTGRYHLTRTAAGGGDASGVFSLIFERDPDGWHIILDHTSG